MGTYEQAIDVLEPNFAVSWRRSGRSPPISGRRRRCCDPLDDELTPWTLFELAGHFDISIGLTRKLLANRDPDGQVGRDRVSFFIFSRSEVAPVVYDYAYTMVEGKTPAQMPDVLHETFSRTVKESRAAAPARSAPATTP